MNEKILSNKKNGMGMLLLFCLLYLIAIAGCVLSAIALEHEFSAPPVIAGLVVSTDLILLPTLLNAVLIFEATFCAPEPKLLNPDKTELAPDFILDKPDFILSIHSVPV